MKRAASVAVVAFAVWYLVTDPHGAAHVVHQVVGLLQQAGTSAAQFLNGL